MLGRSICGAAAAVVLVVGVALAGTVTAQEPTPTPDQRPTEPPASAINCARPFADKRKPTLNVPNGLTATVGPSDSTIALTVVSVPSGATCYTIHLVGAGTNPVFFEWSTDGVGPKTFDLPAP